MKITILFTLLFLTIQSHAQTENVFLITLDGFRWQELFNGADSNLIANNTFVKDQEKLASEFWKNSPDARRKALMPFFWTKIAKDGQIHGNRRKGSKVDITNEHGFSYPGYHEILCGFADDERINSNDKIPNPNQTVLEILNSQSAFKGKVAAFASWDVFPYIINEERSNIPVNAGFETPVEDLTQKEIFLNELQARIPSPWSSVRLDAFTQGYALEYIKKNNPRVVYIAYGETDDFAHHGAYDEYLYAARRTDGFIAELWDYVQSSENYRNKTTFIITTDHGRGEQPAETWTNHSKGVESTNQIWVALIGPNISAQGEVKNGPQLYQSQVAKTLAYYLGVDYANEKAGQVMQLIK